MKLSELQEIHKFFPNWMPGDDPPKLSEFPPLPEEFKAKAVEIIRTKTPKGYIDELRDFAANNRDWVAMTHFWAGMAIRNLLRSNGLDDEMLPTGGHFGGWDNYYVECLESAMKDESLEEAMKE
jgi:hypothetical protein